jgi:hypothetical protein
MVSCQQLSSSYFRNADITSLPKSLKRHSPGWWRVVLITIVGELLAVLGTFLPMKAILILAGGGVPGFFPQFMIDSGEVFSAFFLLVLAGVFGFLAWLAETLVRWLDLDQKPAFWKSRQATGADYPLLVQAKRLRQIESMVLLLVPLFSILSTVSLFFVGLMLLWVVVSAVIVAQMARRSPPRAPYLSAVAYFANTLGNWLKSAALWSTVGLAFTTLLIAPPPLGPTAILIATVLGRRLVLAVADVLPNLTWAAKTRANVKGKGEKSQSPHGLGRFSETARWPIEFLASSLGSEIFRHFLQSLDLSSDDYRVLGPSRASALSIVVCSEGGDQVLLRVFGINQGRARDLELDQRASGENFSPFPASPAFGQILGGYPVIVVKLDNQDVRVDFDAPVPRAAHVDFQLSQELRSLGGASTVNPALLPDINRYELESLLATAANIAGPQVSVCKALKPHVRGLLAMSDRIPVGMVPSKPLFPESFYVSESGLVCYLGGHEWSPGRPGDRWGVSPVFRERFANLITEDSASSRYALGTINLEDVVINSLLHALYRALLEFQLGSIQELGQKLVDKLGVPNQS